MKKQRVTEGAFVKVPLHGSIHAYARVIAEKSFAFYDCFTVEDLSLDIIKECSILFIIPVHQSALSSGRWEKIGTLPLENKFLSNPPMFMQDALNPSVFHIYENGEMRLASKKECVGLERFAEWEAEHVEDRLKDYYEGKPNKWVESLKMI